jgi:hypothetical protein
MGYGLSRGMGSLTPYEYAQCNSMFLRGILNPYCWQWVDPASKLAVPPAPTGDVLTVPPASGEQAQATVDALVNQQMVDQQALNASQVTSSWWDEVTGAVGSVSPTSSTSWLLYGVLAVVGVIALVSVGGGSPRRYGR